MEERISQRKVWVDWMRVGACLMVMTVHATEPFYLGGEGALILTGLVGLAVRLRGARLRAAVRGGIQLSAIPHPLSDGHGCPVGDDVD